MEIIDQDIKKFPSGTSWFNSSIIRWSNELIMAYRYADNNRYLTNIHIAKLDGNYQVASDTLVNIHFPEQRFFEDPRLFIHNGKLWLSYILARMTPSRHIACQRICELDENFQPVKHIHPQFGNNINEAVTRNGNWQGEKNWTFYSFNKSLYAIYCFLPTVVLKVENDGTCKIVKDIMPKFIWNYGRISGSTQHLEMNGMMYGAFHSFTWNKIRNYHMGFYEYDPREMMITKISRTPFLSAFPNPMEDLRPPKMGWRPNCIFPCGIEIDKNNILISYGWQDCRSKILKLSIDEMVNSLGDIEEYLCKKRCLRDPNVCSTSGLSVEIDGIIYKAKSYSALRARLEKNKIDINDYSDEILKNIPDIYKEDRWVRC